MLLFLPWLLKGQQRPEYTAFQQQFAGDEDGLIWEAGTTAKLLVAIVAARFTFNALLREPMAGLAARRGGADAGHKDGAKLLEEAWVLLGNTFILGAAMYVVLYRNGGCWFGDTSTCLAGWPALPADPAVNWYYHVELSWYLHMLLKPVLRYGLRDGRDMLVHHCATLALIVTSYGTNLTRIGVLVLATFAISNPLLHFAKICNQLSLGPLKIGGFVLFAVAFFLSRVLLVPWAVLKPAMLDSRTVIPHVLMDFAGIYYGINTLLAVLYVLQLLWMRGIVRVLRSALQHGADAASRMSAQVDPAKRYAAAHQAEPAESASGSDSDRGRGVRISEVQQRRSGGGSGRGVPQTPSPVEPGAGLAAALECVGENDKVK